VWSSGGILTFFFLPHNSLPRGSSLVNFFTLTQSWVWALVSVHAVTSLSSRFPAFAHDLAFDTALDTGPFSLFFYPWQGFETFPELWYFAVAPKFCVPWQTPVCSPWEGPLFSVSWGKITPQADSHI
jgi:hypothetical protein